MKRSLARHQILNFINCSTLLTLLKPVIEKMSLPSTFQGTDVSVCTPDVERLSSPKAIAKLKSNKEPSLTIGEEETDHISLKRFELQQEVLVSLKDDISDWILKTIGPTNINAKNFAQALDNGVILCQLSQVIERKAKICIQQGTFKGPLPDYKIHCNKNAKSGTWFARDNTTNFLKWCRAYGMMDETLFDSEDLVTHHKERQVIYCLMELARLGARFGIEPPSLISMEVDLECESTLSNEEASMSTPPLLTSEPTTSVDATLTTETTMLSTMQETDMTISTKTSTASLDSEIARVSTELKKQDHVTKLSEGVYNVFGKHVFIRLLKGKHLMVRVGGGWDTFEHYLLHHDPIHIYEFHKGSHSMHSPREVRDTENLAPDPKKFLVVKSRYS